MKKVSMPAALAAEPSVYCPHGSCRWDRFAQAGVCPEPSALSMHERCGARPVRTAARVGEQHALPA
jgi:hypothetical protein